MKIITKIKEVLKIQEYEVINSFHPILKIFVKEKKFIKNEINYKSTVLVSGLFYFDCEFGTKELIVLEKFFELYCYKTKEIPSKESIEKVCLKINTHNKLPLFKLIYLFFSENKTNLSKLIQNCKDHPEYLSLTKKEDKSFFIMNQVYLNRESLLNFLSETETPLNQWAFSNGNLVSKFSRAELIKEVFPSYKKLDGYYRKEYEDCASFDELYKLITSNKKVSFEKELKNHLLSNIFNSSGGYSFLNTNLFEKLRTLFQMNIQDLKSFKEFQEYLSRLDKIVFNKQEPFAFIETNLRNTLLEFCSMFQEKPLEVLKKSNIPYHLYKQNISLLKKYYEEYPVLSIKKEKKLYYFLNHLSKRVSSKIENFDLNNPNKNYNNSLINYSCDNFSLSTIKDFKELFQIGVNLNNCAGNFENIHIYQNHYNFIVRTKDNKEFLGSIKNGKFDQLKGYKNASPSLELFKEVNSFLISKDYLYKKDYSEDELKELYKKACIHTIFIN